MQILWSERAFERRRAVEDYILLSFGYKAYSEFVEKVDEWKSCVIKNPEIGREEPLLIGMRKKYRSYVIGNLSKCIYYVEGEFIVIADWWDTRRSISNLKRGI